MPYSKYETTAGQANEAATFGVLIEHLRLAAENCYTLGHLCKANDKELTGQGWLAVGQLLENMVKRVTSLATKGVLQ